MNKQKQKRLHKLKSHNNMMGLMLYILLVITYVALPSVFEQVATPILFSESLAISATVFVIFCYVGYIDFKNVFFPEQGFKVSLLTIIGLFFSILGILLTGYNLFTNLSSV